MAFVFWASVFLIGYAYIGYPVLLMILSSLRPRPHAVGDETPPVTVVVTAFNEEGAIAAKLDCLLAQNYPKERMWVLVASDGSTDATDAIVERYAPRGVQLLRVFGRKGKTEAQNQAVRSATTEFLVFTDATTHLEPDAVRTIMRPFADPEVGCVGGELTYISRKQSGVGRGGVSYWGYERSIKRNESRVNSLIGVSGCFYALRRTAYREIPAHLISDFMVALNAYDLGFRTVYEPNARSVEETLDRGDREFTMRVRVAVRSFGALWAMRRLLNPVKTGLFAVQLFSHKVLRYGVAPLLLTTLISSVGLVVDSTHATNPLLPLYLAALGAQITVYGAALAGFLIIRSGGRGVLFSKPYYFVLVNLAVLMALVRFARGERMVTWTPVR
ncbi:MAG: glycosyltransferase family 2 protein [Nitrospirota bacterium]|nr:glycosyltransferase family 2 protein [Nitrospirota bacterium]